jgi:drug/metabolite transporter (DMT)-like permease
LAQPVGLRRGRQRRTTTISNAERIIFLAAVVALAIAIPVDPRKDTRSKWLFWVIGPTVCAALFAVALYGSVKNPEASDLVGAVVGGAFFAYLCFGAVFVRKRWPIGRWPGSRS